MAEIKHNVEDEFDTVNYITLRRIYDVLLGIYSNINETEADTMAAMHERGEFASPEPAYRLRRTDEGQD